MQEEELGTRSKVSLLDQHSELKKKAEGTYYTPVAIIGTQFELYRKSGNFRVQKLSCLKF